MVTIATAEGGKQHVHPARAARRVVLSGARLRRSEVVALDAGAGGAALADWLRVRGDTPGPLFWAVRRSDHRDRTGRRLTDQAVYDVVHRRATKAGVRAASPYDVRHTFISDLLDAGAHLAAVQQCVGRAQGT